MSQETESNEAGRHEEIATDAWFATDGRWCRASDEDGGRFFMLSCAVCGGVPEDTPGPWHLVDAGRGWHCGRAACADAWRERAEVAQ